MCDVKIWAVTGLDQNGDSVGVIGRVTDCPEPLEGARSLSRLVAAATRIRNQHKSSVMGSGL